MPKQIAFRMNLFPGQAAEYKKRHDEVYPELKKALKDAGVSDYSIWLDAESYHLFGILTLSDDNTLAEVRDNPQASFGRLSRPFGGIFATWITLVAVDPNRSQYEIRRF